jgi:hypothetical protein
MINFPPPPQPPIDSSQLESLAEYYRQLVDYYRRAEAIASQKLTHVEALLHPSEELTFHSSDDLNGWLETPLTNGSEQKALASPLPQLLATASSSQPHTTEEESSPVIEKRYSGADAPSQTKQSSPCKTDSQLIELLATELESHRGKMLHLDYLVRKLFPAIASDELNSAKDKTKSLLKLGMAQQKWFAVPDAPDCWTIDLNEFPDLNEQPSSFQRSSFSAPRTTLFGSERLERYATITLALADCLKEHYPNSMKTKQIADYFYPDGLSDTRRQKVHVSLSHALSAENNKLWKRVRVGEYVWKKSYQD